MKGPWFLAAAAAIALAGFVSVLPGVGRVGSPLPLIVAVALPKGWSRTQPGAS